MLCNLYIDNEPFKFQVNGSFYFGDSEILYDERETVIKGLPWEECGYTIVPILSNEQFLQLHISILKLLNKILSSVGVSSQLEKLEEYHLIVTSDELHQKVISKTRFLTRQDFAFDINSICKKFSSVVKKEMVVDNPRIEDDLIILRISRPNSLDINPLHRDGYLDIYQDTMNTWIPIAGCNSKSSLPVIPSSHFWDESKVKKTQPKGAMINGLKYHVPGIVEGPVELKAIRPNPNYGEALIFTPYLVHGAAINQNENSTRMSLELRPCLRN